MTQPIVTILIPTYNRHLFLREAVQSAVDQTYRNLEILILDDASPDATAHIAAEFSQDPRVRYIRHADNVGIAENWRVGIETAAGEYFCLLHDDDTIEPSFIEKMLPPLREDSNIILSFCDHWVMNEHGKRDLGLSDRASVQFKRNLLQPGRIGDWATESLVDSTVPVGATLFRKNMVPADFIDIRAKGAIDAWLFYRCVKTGHAAYYIQDRLMNYRLHGGGMSRSSVLYMNEGHVFRNQEILADPNMSALHSQIRELLSASLAHQGVYLLKENKQNAARAALRRSLTLHKTRRNVLAYGLACCGPIGSTVARVVHSG